MGIINGIVGFTIRLINAASCGQHFSVLNYHRVLPAEQQEYCDALSPELFEQQLIWLKNYFNVLSLPNAMALAAQNQLPANSVVITIDDGFNDCFYYIYPLLKRHQLTATFFITTAGLHTGSLWESHINHVIRTLALQRCQLNLRGQTYEWHDAQSCQQIIQRVTERIKYLSLTERRAWLTELELQAEMTESAAHSFLTPAQLQQMFADGMTIGAHTVNHPILALEQTTTALEEISQSKTELEQIISAPVEFFAYPNGKYGQDFTDEHIDMVRQLGFSAAFCTEWGLADMQQGNRYVLKRFTPWDKDPARFCLRLAISALSERVGFGWLKQFVRQPMAIAMPSQLPQSSQQNNGQI